MPGWTLLVVLLQWHGFMALSAHALRDHVFCLGPMKTGTTTLAAVLRQRGYHPCHGHCSGVGDNWARVTANHRRQPLLGYDAYMDHGQTADFRWLAQTFPKARFVLNTRELKAWLVSRADHARRNRVAGHCSEWGKMCSSAPSYFVDNTDKTIRHWVIDEALHQHDVLTYFNSSQALRNRFIMVDVEGMASSDLNLMLDWVTRSNPQGSQRAPKLVMKPEDVPMHRPQHKTKIPDANSHGHSPETVHRITSLLNRLGCTGASTHYLIYSACAQKARRQPV